jgi:hypothetical protein
MKVAISLDFFDCYAKVSRSTQAKARDFIQKFKTNPMSPGINYERIEGAKEKNLRSCRVDQDMRAIVLSPESGDAYILLWMDRHEEAYRWARNKKVVVNPENGSLQVYEPVDIPAIPTAAPDDQQRLQTAGLFSSFRDKDLVRLGVPADLVPFVRTLENDVDLEAAEPRLPREAFSALFMGAAGYSLEEIIRDLHSTVEPDKTPVAQDYSSALESPITRQNFYLVGDDMELLSMLDAPLEKWRVFLHPAQRSMVERSWNGSVRVLGGAGTGKTVVAMHRARYLAQLLQREDRSGGRVLFTTFTKILSRDIEENLKRLCTPEVFHRIHIVNIDKLVLDTLRRFDFRKDLVWHDQQAELWSKALEENVTDLSSQFFKEEWRLVIQPQQIQDLESYKTANRTGRGTRIDRKLLTDIWSVFERYRGLLRDANLIEMPDAMLEAAKLLELRGNDSSYRYAVIDEAQDMGSAAYVFLRKLLPAGVNDLFIVGDAHQRIYRNRVVLSRCGIDIIGRSRRLCVNYRTTDEIRCYAGSYLKGLDVDDLNGGQDSLRGYRALLHGDEPLIIAQPSDADIVTAIRRFATEKTSCFVAPTNAEIARIQSLCVSENIATLVLGSDQVDDQSKNGLRLATMHRVKGLEFDIMFLLDSAKPNLETSLDPAEKKEDAYQKAALRFVAATRAKKMLVVFRE